MICNLAHCHEIVDMIHVRRDVRQQRMRQNSLTIQKKYMKFSIAIYLLFTDISTDGNVINVCLMH